MAINSPIMFDVKKAFKFIRLRALLFKKILLNTG